MNTLYPVKRLTTTCVLIRIPIDMARLLHTSCPEQALTYAIAAHEKACAGHDEERTFFWNEVTHLLSCWIAIKQAS